MMSYDFRGSARSEEDDDRQHGLYDGLQACFALHQINDPSGGES